MDQIYPRKLTLESPTLEKYLKEKGNLIMEGRMLSEEIEDLEKAMQGTDLKIQEAEQKAEIGDLTDKAKEITEQFNAIVAKMEEIKKEMYDRVKSQVPPELYAQYEDYKKDKEQKELDRNKIGLKVQKWNDKIIPLGRKLMKPYLENEYDDYDTLRLENGEIVATIFNHMNDFKERFKNRN